MSIETKQGCTSVSVISNGGSFTVTRDFAGIRSCDWKPIKRQQGSEVAFILLGFKPAMCRSRSDPGKRMGQGGREGQRSIECPEIISNLRQINSATWHGKQNWLAKLERIDGGNKNETRGSRSIGRDVNFSPCVCVSSGYLPKTAVSQPLPTRLNSPPWYFPNIGPAPH